MCVLQGWSQGGGPKAWNSSVVFVPFIKRPLTDQQRKAVGVRIQQLNLGTGDREGVCQLRASWLHRKGSQCPAPPPFACLTARVPGTFAFCEALLAALLGPCGPRSYHLRYSGVF